MPEDGYANLEAALKSLASPPTPAEPSPPTFDELRKCKAGAEYKEPEELKDLVRGVSCEDFRKTGCMLVFSLDLANKEESPWRCSLFCRVVPGVWLLVSDEHADDEDKSPLWKHCLQDKEGGAVILELDEEQWLAPMQKTVYAKNAVLSVIVASGRKQHVSNLVPSGFRRGMTEDELEEGFRKGMTEDELEEDGLGRLPVSHTDIAPMMFRAESSDAWGGVSCTPDQRNGNDTKWQEKLHHLLKVTGLFIASSLGNDHPHSEFLDHLKEAEKRKRQDRPPSSRCSSSSSKEGIKDQEEEETRKRMALSAERHASFERDTLALKPQFNMSQAMWVLYWLQPEHTLFDDEDAPEKELLEIHTKFGFVAGSSMWRIHRQHVQATMAAWRNLAWNGLDLIIFAMWTAMYLGNVDNKDQASFLGICGLVNTVGMWIFAGGLAQAADDLAGAVYESFCFLVITAFLPLAVLLPLPLLAHGTARSVGVSLLVILVRAIKDHLDHKFGQYITSILFQSYSRRERAKIGFAILLWQLIEGTAELMAWNWLGCSSTSFSMIMLGHVATQCLVVQRVASGWRCSALALSVVRVVGLAQQQRFIADLPVFDGQDGPAADMTLRFLVCMASAMSALIVLRFLMGEAKSSSWKVSHQQRAARRDEWWLRTGGGHLRPYAFLSWGQVENMDLWSAADLYRKRQDKEAKRHLVAELLYDFSQVAVMSWVESNITLTRSDFPGKLAVDFLNWMSTGVDILMLKGPKAFVKSGLPPNPVVDMVIEAIEDADAAEDEE